MNSGRRRPDFRRGRQDPADPNKKPMPKWVVWLAVGLLALALVGPQIWPAEDATKITYTEFLYQSMNKPFTVGLTYLQSATSSQVLETITVTQKDVNGNVASKVLTPTIDPYQFQTDKVAFKFEYRIDGFTNLIISSILATATLKIYFYPRTVECLSPR